jgi:hypothetical protein
VFEFVRRVTAARAIRGVSPVRVVAGLAAGLSLLACAGGDEGSGGHSAQTHFASNGARIFYTGTSDSGTPILAAESFGGPARPPVKSCADCHGPDGGGGLVATDSGAVRAPGIAFARLASPQSYPGHEGYDEAKLALTLRTGVRIDGYLLSPLMPRWQMTTRDMNDLIAHLKTLDPHSASDPPR